MLRDVTGVDAVFGVVSVADGAVGDVVGAVSAIVSKQNKLK